MRKDSVKKLLVSAPADLLRWCASISIVLIFWLLYAISFSAVPTRASPNNNPCEETLSTNCVHSASNALSAVQWSPGKVVCVGQTITASTSYTPESSMADIYNTTAEPDCTNVVKVGSQSLAPIVTNRVAVVSGVVNATNGNLSISVTPTNAGSGTVSFLVQTTMPNHSACGVINPDVGVSDSFTAVGIDFAPYTAVAVNTTNSVGLTISPSLPEGSSVTVSIVKLTGNGSAVFANDGLNSTSLTTTGSTNLLIHGVVASSVAENMQLRASLNGGSPCDVANFSVVGVTISPHNFTKCAGDIQHLTANGSPPGGVYGWGGGNSSSYDYPVPVGTNDVVVTYTFGGAVADDTATGAGNPVYSLSINNASSFQACVGQTNTFVASGAPSGVTYSWSEGSASGPQHETNAVVFSTPALSKTLTVTAGACSSGTITGMVSKVQLNMQGVADDKEDTDGGFIQVNDDDDNGNSTPDKDEGNVAVSGENDLIPITLDVDGMPNDTPITLSCNGTGSGADHIRIWHSAQRDTQGPIIDNADPQKLSTTWPKNQVPGTLYVEGVGTSAAQADVNLTLSGPCSDLVKLTVMKVSFKENASCSGFDPTLTPPWLMVPLPAGGNNKAKAEITPAATSTNVTFQSAAVTIATVAPVTASASPETVTVTSVAEGETEVRAKVGSEIFAILGIDVNKKITKTIKIHAITEENDDVQSIPVGKGKPNTIAISAGTNGTLDSTPTGDDQVSGSSITTGADGICNTTAVTDDIQVISVGNGSANEVCVAAGVNSFRDSISTGDDVVSGTSITTGPDGICDTVANSTDIPPTTDPTATDLQNYLNDTVWAKQANVHFTVTKASHVVNYDLDRSGTLAHPSNGSAPNPAEGDAISTAAKDASVDYNIYYVHARDYSIGTTIPSLAETWTAANGANSPVNHTAHEVGHLLGILYESNDIDDIMLNYGDVSNPCRVIKKDWDTVNPN